MTLHKSPSSPDFRNIAKQFSEPLETSETMAKLQKHGFDTLDSDNDSDSTQNMLQELENPDGLHFRSHSSSTLLDNRVEFVKKPLHIDIPPRQVSSVQVGSPSKKVLWYNPETPLKSALRKSPSPLPRGRSESSPGKLESDDEGFSTPSTGRTPSPKVHFSPKSVIRHFFLSDPPVDVGETLATRYTLRCTMPIQFNPNFMVRLLGVRLPDDHLPIIEGLVKVKNLNFDKKVTVRFSSTNWDTYGEEVGFWVDPSEPCDGIIVSNSGDMDTFKFRIDLSLGHMAKERQLNKILLCIRYESGGQEYWDNAQGRNYEVTIETRVAGIEEGGLGDGTDALDLNFVPSRAGEGIRIVREEEEEASDHESTSDDSDVEVQEPKPRRRVKGVADVLREAVGEDIGDNGFFGR